MLSQRDEVARKGVRTWLDVAALGGLTDAQLLARFAAGGDAAELAFAALVARHGPVVLRACSAVLRNGHDAEDAFQATFLVLVRRYGTLWVCESLGPWLHRVASRVAVRAQVAASRRTRHERHAAESRVEGRDGDGPDDSGPIIHAEIDRLPERYRGPVVLCDLEGHTHEQAADLLGCPVGTVKSRLSRAHARLKARLARRGVVPAAGGVGTLLVAQSAPAVSSKLVLATAGVAKHFATAGTTAAGTVPASALTLAEGVVAAMSLHKLALRCAALLMCASATVGVVALAADRPSAPPEPTATSAPVAPAVPEQPADRDVLPLQGTWEFAACESETWHAPLEEIQKKWRWVVKGNDVTWTGPGNEAWRLTIAVDATRSPKQIDVTFLNGPHKGEKCRGIYMRAGRNELGLHISLADRGMVGRPTEFSFTNKCGRSLILLSPGEADASVEDVKAMQGVWKFGLCQSDWWPVWKPTTKAEYPTWRWTVKGNEMRWTGVSTGDVKVSFTVDPTKTPKQIDFTFLDGPDKGKKCRGIYELKNGRLTLCVQDPGTNAARPKDFSYASLEYRSFIELDPVDASARAADLKLGIPPPERGTSPEPEPTVRRDAAGAPLPVEALARLGSTRLKHGTGMISSMIFTPDSKTLISQSDGQTCTWEIPTGRLVRQFPKNLLTANSNGLSLSPDGKLLASPGKPGLSLWDVATTKEVQSIGTQRFQWMCFSPDGKLLATQGGSRFVDCNIWDVKTGDNLRSWSMAAGSDFATAPVFTRDGKRLITGHRDNTVRVWDVTTGEERHKLTLGMKSLRHIVLSPDGKTVAATAYQSGNIHLIDVAAAQERSRIPAPDRDDVTIGGKQRFTEVAFTPDGQSIVAAGIDDSLIFFDPATGKERRRLDQGFGSVFCMAISPDGKTIATAVGGKTIRLTDLATGRDLVESVGHSFGVWSATFADGGKLVATVGGGREVIVWDAATGRELRRLQGHTAGVISVALAPDGRTLRSTGSDKTVRFWDPTTGKQMRQAALVGSGWNQTRAPDGKSVVVIDGTSTPNVSTLRLLDADTNKELGSQKSDRPWYGSVFSRDGKTLVGWTGDRTVHVLDPATGRQRTQYPIDAGGGGNTYYGVHLSNNGRVLACGSQRATLVIVETATGKTLHSLKGLPDGVSAVAFSPDDTMLAWGGWNDPRIHLIELATGKERHTLAGTSGRVLNLSFSPDGQNLLSGSEDTTATVWDLTGEFRDHNPTGPLNAADLDRLWTTLAESDAADAYRAVQRLAGSPKEAVAYLSQRIKPLPRVPEKELACRIADLDNEDFQTRERATAELDKFGEAALVAYDAALAGNPSAEARRRLATLANKHNLLRTPSRDRLRIMRALEVLERCGPESRTLLSALADGAPGAYMTEQARGALRRQGAVAK